MAWSSLLALMACGGAARKNENSSTIVGGTPVDIGSHPWLVSIRMQRDPSGPSVTLCGGTIMNEHWVLTAAHCIEPNGGRNLWVAAGISNTSNAGVAGQRREIAGKEVHGSYRGSTFGKPVRGEYDVALLYLESPLDLSQPNVSAIELVSPEERDTLTAPGVVATVAGWGSTHFGGGRSDSLREVPLPIVPLDVAKGAYPGVTITDLQLAAGEFGVGGKGACIGDSGGPLVVRDPSTDKMKLAGIVSWGKTCGDVEHPDMYARVSANKEWIDERISGRAFVPERKVKFSTVTAEQFVEGVVDLGVSVSEGFPVTKVEFHLPNERYTDDQAPFSVSWDSRQMLDGKYTIFAKAFDAEGHQIEDTISIPLHVINQPEPRPTDVLVDFEPASLWLGFGHGRKEFNLFKPNSPESPYRGNRSARYETHELLARGGLHKGGHDDRWDLSRYLRLRVWAKTTTDVDLRLHIRISDREGEPWLSKSSIVLTDVYQELRVDLRADQFEKITIEGEEESGNGKLDLESVRITIPFFDDARPEEPDHVIVFVDDLAADLRPRREPASDSELLFDFESEDSQWRAFGEGSPRVVSSIAEDPEVDNKSLRFSNGNMSEFGGVTYRFDSALSLTGVEGIYFDVECALENYVAFGFQDQDGEAWIGPKTFVNNKARQVEASLDPKDLELTDVVPVDGVSRNHAPDLDNIKAFTFVFYSEGHVHCVIDNVIAPKSNSDNATVYEDAEDGAVAGWRAYDDRTGNARVDNVFDIERQSNVIELIPGTENPVQDGFLLENEDGTLWNNENQFLIKWEMKLTSPTFFIYVDVETTAGQRYIYYTNNVENGQNSNLRYIHVGLGPLNDGTWHSVERDLQKDLQSDPQDENETILSVRRFLVRGKGRLDDIQLLSDQP